MSVTILGHLKGYPEKIKQTFAKHASEMEQVTKTAVSKGAITHRFLQGDGEIVILDEWDSAEHFQEFFSSQPVIAQMMQEAGVAGPPDVKVYESLKTVGDF
jgi:heme-degrading monooxygenase HmoA